MYGSDPHQSSWQLCMWVLSILLLDFLMIFLEKTILFFFLKSFLRGYVFLGILWISQHQSGWLLRKWELSMFVLNIDHVSRMAPITKPSLKRWIDLWHCCISTLLLPPSFSNLNPAVKLFHYYSTFILISNPLNNSHPYSHLWANGKAFKTLSLHSSLLEPFHALYYRSWKSNWKVIGK